MFGIFNKNSITKIARVLPPALIEGFDKQSFYSAENVKNVFDGELKTEHNIEYAFAMFCSQSDFEVLNIESTYSDLRTEVSKKCFGSWPRFNFDSLLDYSRRSTMGVDGGAFGGDGGCGEGGGGGE
jgi:hypothetical protein